MAQIHPSSLVERGAQLGEDVVVGPMCYVGPEVTLGAGTRLVSHVTILGRTTLGERNTVWPFATLGGDPQDLKFRGEDSELIIGDDNEIRENVTMHKGTANGGNVTRVGNSNLIMVGCHVAHDCIVGSHIVMANNVLLAGHVLVEDHAAIAGAAAMHHFVTIGQYAYVGGLTRIVHDVPPFMVVEGNPARVRKLNTKLLQRSRFDPDQIDRLKRAYRLLYGERNETTVGRTAQAIAKLESMFPDDPCIGALLASIHRAGEGVNGRYRESLRPDNPKLNPVK